MNNQAIITSTFENKKTLNLSIITWINSIIEREQKNSLGITVMYVMVSSGIGSLTAALSLYGAISLPTLITSAMLAMALNASVLSLQTFKISSWFFIVSVVINTILLITQVINLL